MAMIMAFDLATATGWCAGDGAAMPHLGNVNMPGGGEPGPFMAFWHNWLQRHLDDWKPDHIVFEAPILPQTTSFKTVRKLQGMAAVLEMVCDLRKLDYSEVGASTVKKYLTGSGGGKKPDMMRWAKHIGVNPKTFDEADAFGVWLYSIQFLAPAHLGDWDKRRFKGVQLL